MLSALRRRSFAVFYLLVKQTIILVMALIVPMVGGRRRLSGLRLSWAVTPVLFPGLLTG